MTMSQVMNHIDRQVPFCTSPAFSKSRSAHEAINLKFEQPFQCSFSRSGLKLSVFATEQSKCIIHRITACHLFN